MSESGNERVVMDVLRAIEDRELDKLALLYHPEIWFSWQPGLPYAGRYHGSEVATMSRTFASAWEGLQPTRNERSMDPFVIAERGSTVMTNYTWKAKDQVGRRFQTPVVARYEIRDGLFAGAEMNYFDLLGVIEFLSVAARP